MYEFKNLVIIGMLSCRHVKSCLNRDADSRGMLSHATIDAKLCVLSSYKGRFEPWNWQYYLFCALC